MHALERKDVEFYVVELAKSISANNSVSLNSYVYRDLRISDEDALEFYSDIEKKFDVSLKAITEETIIVPKTLFRKSRSKISWRDPTINDIILEVLNRSTS